MKRALHLTRFKEPVYVLTQPIKWIPEVWQEKIYKEVEVPIGFVTDLASIPQAFWSLLRPDGEYTFPAIVHYYLYWSQDRPREVADKIFQLGMVDLDINKNTINTIYAAVRVGGGASWDRNATLRAQGEKRILKQWPDDPRTRWEDWKKRSDVFASLVVGKLA